METAGSQEMEIVVSGIRPTGRLHLGNYFGAVKNFVQMQKGYHCFFFIADLHALTTHPNPADAAQSIRTVLAEYLASGIDPDQSTIYVQSDLPEVAELYLLLNMLMKVGELERCTAFKDKIRQSPGNINAGLLTYPTLMAADILIHRATKVPVGKDQAQHLEMTRDLAIRFNATYCKPGLTEANEPYFKMPQAFSFDKALIKVPGLLNQGKMSKSAGENDAIFLADSPEVIRKKVLAAVTDSGPKTPNSAPTQAVSNLFDLLDLVSDKAVIDDFKNAYATCKIRYVALKKQLAEALISYLAPIQEKIKHYEKDPAYLQEVAKKGATKAKESAQETLTGLRKTMGIGFA